MSKFQGNQLSQLVALAYARGSMPLLVALVTVASVGALLNREVYAIGDDYHFFGFYFALGGMDYVEAVFQFWSSPFAAGRVFAPVFDLLPLSFMGSVSQFEWVRFLHLFLLLLICTQVFRIVKAEKGDSNLAGLVVLCMISMPGVWHIYMVSYGTSMLVGTSVALAATAWVSGADRSFFQRWSIFGLLAFFVIFTYQPLWPLLFIGISKKLLHVEAVTQSEGQVIKPVRSVRYALTYFGIIMVVACIFALNYVVVRYGYNSPRLSAGGELGAKIGYILFELVPAAVYPWFYLFYEGKQWVVVLSWATIALSLFLTFRISCRWVFRNAGEKSPFQSLFRIALVVLLGTGLLPLSLGMYVFTDQAVGFRRVLFASIYFWVVLLLAINTTLSRTAVCNAMRYIGYGAFVSLAFVVEMFLDVSTQQLAAEEWRNAICATRLSPIKEETKIDSAAVLLPLPFPSAMNNDEVQVRTLSYPTGAMLIWLAHMEVLDRRPTFSPWVLSIAVQPTADSWARAYKQCAAELR